MTDKTDKIHTLEELVEDARFAMITTVATDGSLESRPMTIQEYANGVFRFITKRDTHVAQQGDGTKVNLAIVESNSWISVSGEGRVLNNEPLLERLWGLGNDMFADGGPDDPDNVVFEVRPDSASYWDTPGAIGTVLGLVKAKFTDGDPDVGEQQNVEL